MAEDAKKKKTIGELYRRILATDFSGKTKDATAALVAFEEGVANGKIWIAWPSHND